MMHMITTMVGINVLSVDVVSEKVIWILTTLIDFSNLFIALDGGSYKTLVEAQKKPGQQHLIMEHLFKNL